MKPEELKEYLGIVVDMEQNIFMQGQIMDQWEREIAELGKARQFQEPSHPQEKPLPEKFGVSDNAPPQPTPPIQPKIIRYTKRAFKVTFFLCLLITACDSLFLGGIAELVAAPIASALQGTVVAAITAAIVYFFDDVTIDKIQKYYNQKKQYTAAAEAYPAVLEQYRQQRQRQWQQACQNVQQSNQAAMGEYQKKLDAYHNDIAEDRHRVTLENIKKDVLEAERQSVYMTQMTRQLSALQASSALTAYQSERTQKELHYMNRMNYLSGKNDDVFFNIPPV